MLSLGMAHATLSRSRMSLRTGCALAMLALAGCADEGDYGLPGHWFPTEINGQDVSIGLNGPLAGITYRF